MIFRSPKEQTPVYMMMPLRDIVIFPAMIAPLFVGRQRSIIAVEKAIERGRQIVLCTQKDASVDSPTLETIYQVGTIAAVLQMIKLPDGSIKVLVEGKKRCRIKKFVHEDDCFAASIEELDDIVSDAQEVKALHRLIVASLEGYVKLNKRISQELFATLCSLESSSRLADLLAPQLEVPLAQKQELLELVEAARDEVRKRRG